MPRTSCAPRSRACAPTSTRSPPAHRCPRASARTWSMPRAQLAELTVLVGDLVDLSKTGVEVAELEDVRLDLAAAAAVRRARARTPGCRYVVHAEPCLVRAAPARLDRAIANLLDNACKWGAEAGHVEV